MEKKKLQRVIGISVVVAFVIVLIPFLFGKRELPQQQEASAPTSSTLLPQQTASATASDANQPTVAQNNAGTADMADANNTNMQNTAEDNGITPITAPPVASNPQSAAPVTVVNPADTNSQPTAPPTQLNNTAQNTNAMAPANTTNSANPPSAMPNPSPSVAPVVDNNLPAENKVEVVPAVTSEVDETAHPQATAEQAATLTTVQEVKSHAIHKKSGIAKKASHFSEKKAGDLKKSAWVVQMGSFKDKSNAHRLVNQLKTSGFKAFTHEVTSPAGAVRTRVYIGPEFKQASAMKLSTKIEHEVKLRGFVVPYKPMA